MDDVGARRTSADVQVEHISMAELEERFTRLLLQEVGKLNRRTERLEALLAEEAASREIPVQLFVEAG